MAKTVPVYGISSFSRHSHEDYFYANELSAHLESHRFINAPHKHSTYITIIFTHGTGEHQIDFDVYKIKPGSVFLLSPGQVHCWKLSDDVKGFVFFHTKEFFDEIFIKKKIEHYPFYYLQQNYPVIYLSSSHIPKIEMLFNDIYEEYKQKAWMRESKLGLLVDLVYVELSRLYKDKGAEEIHTNYNYIRVKKLQKLIDENFRGSKLPVEYAKLMNISIRQLNRICTDVLKKSVGDLIAERIIIEAKRLLIQQNMSVSIVADELGYADYSYFIRMFKKRTGLSPKQFQFKNNSPYAV